VAILEIAKPFSKPSERLAPTIMETRLAAC
jgi:hypothetical protein